MLLTWLGLLLTSEGRHWGDPNELDPKVILMLLVLTPYLALIYFALPHLIYPKTKGTANFRIGWLFFAALTAGIGPVVLYWKKVDPYLSAWIKAKK